MQILVTVAVVDGKWHMLTRLACVQSCLALDEMQEMIRKCTGTLVGRLLEQKYFSQFRLLSHLLRETGIKLNFPSLQCIWKSDTKQQQHQQ